MSLFDDLARCLAESPHLAPSPEQVRRAFNILAEARYAMIARIDLAARGGLAPHRVWRRLYDLLAEAGAHLPPWPDTRSVMRAGRPRARSGSNPRAGYAPAPGPFSKGVYQPPYVVFTRGRWWRTLWLTAPSGEPSLARDPEMLTRLRALPVIPHGSARCAAYLRRTRKRLADLPLWNGTG